MASQHFRVWTKIEIVSMRWIYGEEQLDIVNKRTYFRSVIEFDNSQYF